MKIHILSDLHIEFENFEPPDIDSDIVVLAGDIHVKEKGLRWAIQAFADKTVLYVLGNHEFYGTAYPKHLHKLKEQAKGTNVTVLEKEVFHTDGVSIYGCSLWTDFNLFGDSRMAGYEATQRMSDYKRIRVSPTYRKLRSIDTAGIHHGSMEWLKAELKKETNNKKVVVTHHAPSLRSVPENYQNDILSAAYASNLEDFIQESQIDIWIHGHLHNQSDYYTGRTRIICNPRGYPDERNELFIPDLTVAIGSSSTMTDKALCDRTKGTRGWKRKVGEN